MIYTIKVKIPHTGDMLMFYAMAFLYGQDCKVYQHERKDMKNNDLNIYILLNIRVKTSLEQAQEISFTLFFVTLEHPW